MTWRWSSIKTNQHRNQNERGTTENSIKCVVIADGCLGALEDQKDAGPFSKWPLPRVSIVSCIHGHFREDQTCEQQCQKIGSPIGGERIYKKPFFKKMHSETQLMHISHLPCWSNKHPSKKTPNKKFWGSAAENVGRKTFLIVQKSSCYAKKNSEICQFKHTEMG